MIPQIIAILALVAALAAGGVCVLLWRRIAGLERALAHAEAQVQQVGENFHGLAAGSVGQGEHIVRMEADLGRMRERMEQLATSGSDGAAFNQAIRMARKGVPAREIMETCGLSQMEAELVLLLHRESVGA